MQLVTLVIDDTATDATDGYLSQLSHSTNPFEHAMMEHSQDCLGFYLVSSQTCPEQPAKYLPLLIFKRAQEWTHFSGVAKSLIHTQISQKSTI